MRNFCELLEWINLFSKKTWKGIYVIGNENQTSRLDHVQIKNTIALADGLLKLSGGVNFYNTNVEIKNSQIKNTLAEDALNIIKSNFILKNLTISNTFSDAFDSDFSTGVIDSCSFFDVDGDAVDLSGSEVNIKNSKFKRNQIIEKSKEISFCQKKYFHFLKKFLHLPIAFLIQMLNSSMVSWLQILLHMYPQVYKLF